MSISRSRVRSSTAVSALVVVAALPLALAEPVDAAPGPAATPQVVSGNLIANGNAEKGAGSSDGSTVPVPKWTIVSGTNFTAVKYGAGGGFPLATDPGPASRGANFFAGGPGGTVNAAQQTKSLSPYVRAIDAGTATFSLQGYLGGFSSQQDNATLTVEWLDAGSAVLGSSTIGPVTAADRGSVTGLLLRKSHGSVPVGARTARITLTLTRVDGSYDDGYADNLVLKLTT